MTKRLTISSADQRKFYRLDKMLSGKKTKVKTAVLEIKKHAKEIHKVADNLEKGFRAVKVVKEDKEK